MIDLTVIIMTFNEEKHIERCIRCILPITQHIYVVDSFSTDQTVNIVQSLGAQVWQHEFINQAAQYQWALDHLPLETAWVMRIDADEIVTERLAKEIIQKIPDSPEDVTGYMIPRYVAFEGRILRHGGLPHWFTRVWKNGLGRVEQRWMDEHVTVIQGRVEKMNGEFIDHNLNDISWWTNKHNNYATREAIDLLNQKYRFMRGYDNPIGLEGQAKNKRWIKENIYSKLPIGFRAFLFFLFRFVIKLGFLDGYQGMVYLVLQGFWYRFLVDVKVWEIEAIMRKDHIECTDAIRQHFGIKINSGWE